MSGYREIDRNHRRIETRCCTVTDIARPVWGPEVWPGMRPLTMTEARRETGDTLTTERRYYVSSLPPDAARMAPCHPCPLWGIENEVHGSLDMALVEDQRRVRVNDTARNFAILWRISLKALNLPRRDTIARGDLKNRTLKANANVTYRSQILRLADAAIFCKHLI